MCGEGKGREEIVDGGRTQTMQEHAGKPGFYPVSNEDSLKGTKQERKNMRALL